MSRRRVHERLEKIRARFPAVEHSDDLDKDFEHVTGTQEPLRADRCFYLGEIFWVMRQGWGNLRGFGTNASRKARPGLVIRREMAAHKPVPMAPGTRSEWYANRRIEFVFRPEASVAWDRRCSEDGGLTHFVIDVWRPVPRHEVSWFMGRLAYKDQMRLQQIVRQSEVTGSQADPEELQ